MPFLFPRATSQVTACRHLATAARVAEHPVDVRLARTEADIHSHVLSVKNPKSGMLIVDSLGEEIWDDLVMECNGKIVLRKDVDITDMEKMGRAG